MTPAGPRGLRAAFAGLALVAAMTVTGCSDDSKKPTGQSVAQAAVPGRSAERSPAATAGGACQLLDFYAVQELIGVYFEIAASSAHQATATCVLQRTGETYPDLTLAITPTTATAESFRTTFPPGATPIAGLGVAAYQLLRPAAAGAGISVELGWISKNGRLMVVRYRFGTQAPQSEADAIAPRLHDLAKFVDG